MPRNPALAAALARSRKEKRGSPGGTIPASVQWLATRPSKACSFIASPLCRLPTADCRLPTADWPGADWRLPIRYPACMSSLCAGIDVVEIERVKKTLARHPERFLSRIYTPLEIAYCHGRIRELAARFAAKEATMKALGTGIRGVGWREIEILPDRRGKR